MSIVLNVRKNSTGTVAKYVKGQFLTYMTHCIEALGGLLTFRNMLLGDRKRRLTPLSVKDRKICLYRSVEAMRILMWSRLVPLL